MLPEMRPLMERFDMTRLEADSNVVYALTPDLRLGYLNPAWYRFARANAGAAMLAEWGELGRPMLDAIAGPLRERHRDLIATAQMRQTPVEQRYLCSNPQLQQTFMLRYLPLGDTGGLLVSHARVAEEPHAAGHPFTPAYLHANGFIYQCSNCRRLRHPDAQERWDWVPESLERSPFPVSHGLCEPCLGFYYPPMM